MSEHETIADIIAEMRSDANADEYTPDGILGQKLNYIADRLDAAHKREVGDCAKLREAVKAVVDVGYPHNFQREAPHIRGYCYDITRAIEKCFAALAAPPRNCDAGTAEEQLKRFKDFCRIISKDETCDGCPLLPQCSALEHCTLKWAQMPYEEGGAK